MEKDWKRESPAKKEWDTDIFCNTNEPWKHVKWKDIKEQISSQKAQNRQVDETEVDQWGKRIWGRTNSRCEVSGHWGMIKMFCDLQHIGFEYKASVNIYICSLSHRWTPPADLPGYWYLCCPRGSRKAVLSRPTGTIQPFCYLLVGPQATPEAHLTAGSVLWV